MSGHGRASQWYDRGEMVWSLLASGWSVTSDTEEMDEVSGAFPDRASEHGPVRKGTRQSEHTFAAVLHVSVDVEMSVIRTYLQAC